MLFTMTWLANIFTHYQGKLNETTGIDAVFIDSRKEVTNALFIPIVGEHFDGHDFVEQAVENGAVAILWDQSKPLPQQFPHEVVVFFAEDTTNALQQLAQAYRNKIEPTVIGITGSNGKTTTKDLVATVVQSSFRTHCTDGNFNNHIGLPLTILSMPTDTGVLVLEMGMSDFDEIDLLSRIAQPDYAIITNIGESHIEFLGTRRGIVEAKLEIQNGMNEQGHLIIDGDERDLHHLHEMKNVTTCGFKHSNHVMIDDVCLSHATTTFQVSGHKYEIPLLGKHHAKNATYAITLAKRLGIKEVDIKTSLRHLQITSMRFEILTGKNEVTIINDAYNASPTSMKAAIDVVKNLTDFNSKVLVLGDVFELGKQSKKFHQSIGQFITEPISTVFTIGEEAKEIAHIVQKENSMIDCEHFSSKNELIKHLEPYLMEDTVILFKASRGMELEQLVNEIKQEVKK